MEITPLGTGLIQDVMALMELGEPYIRVRTASDYWLYAHLFASTCPVATLGDSVVGAVISFRSQEDPDDVYIQDVITHPDYRLQGITRGLLDTIRARGEEWGCRRIYLTSEPRNLAAHGTWTTLGFKNISGDFTVGEVSVVADYKGPGKDRAVYELLLR